MRSARLRRLGWFVAGETDASDELASVQRGRAFDRVARAIAGFAA